MPPRPPPPRVAIAATDTGLYDLVAGAARHAGCQAYRVGPDPKVTAPVECDLLVVELPPADDCWLVELRRLRRRRPLVPVLVCYQPEATPIDRLAALSALPHVVCHPRDHRPGGDAHLSDYVRELAKRAPGCLAGALLVALLCPGDNRISAYVTACTERLADRTLDALTSIDLASGVGIRPRTLQALCRRRGLPPPKRLLQWVTLIYVAYAAVWTGMSSPGFARTLGIDEKRWSRLRRLLPVHMRQHVKTADDLLTAAVFALAAEVGVPQWRAVEVLGGLRLSA